MAPRSTFLLVTFAAALSLGFQACSDASPQEAGGLLTEIQPDCLVCLESLTECTSTVKNEQQFVECRDVFQACQEKMSLGPDECGRPSNEVACELCRDRNDSCGQGNCDVEFSVCKTFLMSRAQDDCQAEAAPLQAGCDSCYQALAACASGGDNELHCMKTFYSCRTANSIEPVDCADPTPEQVCTACSAVRDLCNAGGASDCDADFALCSETLDGGCESGGTGGGGGGPVAPPACAQDACEIGDVMDPTCDSCVAAVCEADAYCCEVAYDEYCVAEAQDTSACGCAPVITCEHDLCEAGPILDPACDGCVETVCAEDGYCCNTEWDDLCVSRAIESCSLTCE
jgi:hypothetical protein